MSCGWRWLGRLRVMGDGGCCEGCQWLVGMREDEDEDEDGDGDGDR
jgi:hypothetical protein